MVKFLGGESRTSKAGMITSPASGRGRRAIAKAGEGFEISTNITNVCAYLGTPTRRLRHL